MARELSIAQARNRFPALVHEVEDGEPVRLTRRGKPVAVLLSLREYERLGARRADLWETIESFRRQADLRELDVDDVFADVRDRPLDATQTPPHGRGGGRVAGTRSPLSLGARESPTSTSST